MLQNTNQTGFIIKISNDIESEQELDMQNLAMQHLFDAGLKVPQVIQDRQGRIINKIESAEGKQQFLRVLS